MAVPSDGSYDVPEKLIFGFPCVCKDGKYEIVGGIDINDFGRGKINATIDELKSEAEAVKELL